MTVIPITARPKRDHRGALPSVTPVTGSLNSPSGRSGTFAGSFRLERFLSPAGEPAVSGVFTGELTDADGTSIGVGSRRHSATIEVIPTSTGLVVRLAPVDVEMIGINVAVDGTVIDCDAGNVSEFGYSLPGRDVRSSVTSGDLPVVEQAKGVMVGLAHCTPAEARAELVVVAEEHGVTVRALATAIVVLASDCDGGQASMAELRSMILSRWGDLAAD